MNRDRAAEDRARSRRVLPYGTSATFVDLGCDAAPDRATRTHALAAALRAAWPEADVVLGAGTLVVVGVLPDAVRAVAGHDALVAPSPGKLHTVATVYDGPDLEEVAAALGVSTADVIARHVEPEYAVELLGFMPGFAYLGAPSFALAVPRRSTPRSRVPAGSVGVAASFTGIYPFGSPGGWNLIGRVASAVLFDPARDPPALFGPGDRVRFVAVSAGVAPSEGDVEPSPAPALRGLLVTAAPACATVQDHGRRGRLGAGIPPSGPLDVEAFDAANATLGNLPGAAAVEVAAGVLEIEARGGPAWVSADGERAVRLADGERFRVAAIDRAVRYLAVRGGVDVPVVLGARATLLAARIGGHLGRPLRRGDMLPLGDAVGASPPPAVPPSTRLGHDDALVVDEGPHVDRFPAGAYEALLAGPWTISRLGDRVGVRLEGARVPREGPDLALPVPMIRGAIEITTDGTPIVLGPDHPTTGGYPVLAVLRASSQPALARRRPGEAVRFVDGRSRS